MDLFSRVPPDFRPVIQAAREAIPTHLHPLITTRFLCGVSPVFVGLHHDADIADGRSYHDTAHVCYGPWHTPDDQTTVVLPRLPAVRTVIHELGHVLDEATNFAWDVPETTPYSRTDRYERFAEAFTLLLNPHYEWRGSWLDYLSAEQFRPFSEMVRAH